MTPGNDDHTTTGGRALDDGFLNGRTGIESAVIYCAIIEDIEFFLLGRKKTKGKKTKTYKEESFHLNQRS